MVTEKKKEKEKEKEQTSNQNTCIQRLRPYHLLRIHTHQIPQKHTRRRRKRLMHTDSRELDREPTAKVHPALSGFDKLGHVRVAGVEAGEGVDDANYWAGEGVFGVSQGFDEDFAEEQGEVCVSVGC